MNAALPMDAVLCYVDGPWAWFTTQPLADQWGDDWNDAPYEHNAGDPYGPAALQFAAPTWRVFRVAWEGPFVTPDVAHRSRQYSVEQINAGAVAWLAPDRYRESHGMGLYAGTPLAEFIRRVQSAGGNVYLPAKALEASAAEVAVMRKLAEDRADYFASRDGGRKEGGA